MNSGRSGFFCLSGALLLLLNGWDKRRSNDYRPVCLSVCLSLSLSSLDWDTLMMGESWGDLYSRIQKAKINRQPVCVYIYTILIEFNYIRETNMAINYGCVRMHIRSISIYARIHIFTSLIKGISIVVGYLMPKPCYQKNISGTIWPVDRGIRGFIPFPKILVWRRK